MRNDILDRLKKIAQKLKREYGAEKVILYGSYARGEETEHSDTDILVIANAEKRFFERRAEVLKILRDLYDGLALSPIVLTPKEIEESLRIGDIFIQEILEEGQSL